MQDNIAELLAARKSYREEIQALTRSYRYVVFYGCGAIFSSIVDTWMEYVGRRIDYCCDSDPAKWGQTFCGVKCLSPQELLEIKSDCAIFVTVGKFRPVFDFLRGEGCPSVNLIYKYDLVGASYLDEQDDEFVADRLRHARSLFADERSLQVFDTILRRALAADKDIELMPSICDPNQYFNKDVMALAEDESYVDIGAYDGDTVGYFMKAANNRFDSIHAFELDPANYRQLLANVEKMPNRERVKPVNFGVWDEECEIRFSTGKSQSTVGAGENVGRVVPLDKALADQRVSFIKMDIEGAELHALRGGRQLISSQKPKLAVCVYHHISHLWEIPAYIRELLPEHRLFLRHYTNLEYETVCYAVP